MGDKPGNEQEDCQETVAEFFAAMPGLPPLPALNEREFLGDEWTHDHGLRYLDDRGVRYEDEANRLLDHAAEDLPTPADLVERHAAEPQRHHGQHVLAGAEAAAAAARAIIQKSHADVGLERSGQLSPSHTPGIEQNPGGGGAVTGSAGKSRSRGQAL
jgi:hypothetical protein